MKTGVLLTVLAIVFPAFPCTSAEDPKAAAAPAAKVYEIHLNVGTQGGRYVLENVEPVDFKGLKCLKGRFVKVSHWAGGQIFYIPVDKILVLIEYESLESFQKDNQPAPAEQLNDNEKKPKSGTGSTLVR